MKIYNVWVEVEVLDEETGNQDEAETIEINWNLPYGGKVFEVDTETREDARELAIKIASEVIMAGDQIADSIQ